MESYKIRAAELTDIETIQSFQLLLARESEGILLDKEVLINGLKAVFDDPSKGKYFLCTHQGTAVASLMITYEWSDWRNGMVWWIQSVYVEASHRKSGVFSRMYEFIRQKAIQDPQVKGLRLYVDTTNFPALEVYKKVGMNGDHYRVFEWMKDQD